MCQGNYDFFVEADDTKGGLREAIDDLHPNATMLQILSRNAEAEGSDGQTGKHHMIIACHFGTYYMAKQVSIKPLLHAISDFKHKLKLLIS